MVTRRVWSLVSLLALLGTLMPAWAATRGSLGVGLAASNPPAGPGIDPQILEEMVAAPDGTTGWFILFREQADLSPAYDIDDWDWRGWFVYDALRATAERSQARVRTWLEARGMAYRSFFGANSLFVRADETTLYALAAFPEVAGFRANYAYTIPPISTKAQSEQLSPDAVAWGISRVGADRVWADFGVKGQGIVVAHIDTGAEYTHDALYPNYKCGAGPHADCWLDPSGVCPTAPCDMDDRGTHLMGILVGDDDPALTYNAGMAPDARWIACRGCSQSRCDQLSITTCADWILAPNGNPSNRPHVVNVSLEGIGCDPWFRSYVQAWRAEGLFSSFMAGGGGPACATISTLAGYPESFSVGATDENDYILSSSGRGPSCYDEIKPEVSAPGRNICSSIPGNGWACGYSGTSFANAHAAGLAALLFSANPGLAGDLAATEYLITSTAVCREDLYCAGYPCPGNNNVYGWGRIDAYAAVAAALQPCEPVSSADFAWQPLTPTAGTEVTFTASASGTSPISYTWELGDGTPAEGQIVTHTCDQPGTYTVVLTATNCQGAGVATATDLVTVQVQPCEPVYDAVFAWTPFTPTMSQVVTFSGSAGGTLPITYSWKLGDGTWKTGQVVTHSYDLSGTYTVVMTATNCGTVTAVVTRTISVQPVPCQPAHDAAFAWTPFTPSAGLIVTFTASAGGTLPITFTWDWGDDITGSGAIATHTYGTPGTFTVTLRAENRCGEELAIHCLMVAPASWRIYLPLLLKQTLRNGE